ncbi:MAG: HigA family addiction module antidote protein [Alphaproteobacteria bacterium]|nr:HigA family addiction module antidote protein [Alphaproteobacteria bacterium]
MTNPLTAGLRPVHPGELLREDVLPAFGRPKAEIARLLGISRQQLYDILEERKPVTMNTALRLGKLCGDGPDIWLRMQMAYDKAQVMPELAPIIEKIPTLEAA